MKWLVLAVLAIYVVSPADFLPGPVDDLIAIFLYMAANRRGLQIGRKDEGIKAIESNEKEIEY